METNHFVEAIGDKISSAGPPTMGCWNCVGRHGLHGIQPSHSSPRTNSSRGPAEVGPTTARHLCSELCHVGELTAVLEQVCSHYGVEHGAVALQRNLVNGAIDFVALRGVAADAEAALRRHSTKEVSLDTLKLFRHHLRRELPVIVQETSKVAALQAHPLVNGKPHIKFYVAAPLMAGPGEHMGTISIFSTSGRIAFTLEDCKVLQAAAVEVAKIFTEAS